MIVCVNGQKQWNITMETVREAEGSAVEQSVSTFT